MRDTQSIRFLSVPGSEKLYSGDASSSPSAGRDAPAELLRAGGNPVLLLQRRR